MGLTLIPRNDKRFPRLNAARLESRR
jgi:hypothetical protein